MNEYCVQRFIYCLSWKIYVFFSFLHIRKPMITENSPNTIELPHMTFFSFLTAWWISWKYNLRYFQLLEVKYCWSFSLIIFYNLILLFHSVLSTLILSHILLQLCLFLFLFVSLLSSESNDQSSHLLTSHSTLYNLLLSPFSNYHLKD